MVIYCPFELRRLRIGSEIIDSMDEFLMFLLEAVYEKNNVDQIKLAVGLDKSVVEDNIDYLVQVGFISRNEDYSELKVLDSGINYIKLKDVIDKFNEDDNKIAINMFTGEVVTPPVKMPAQDVIEGVQVFPKRVNYFITQNRDYENSKDFVFSNFSDKLNGLNEEQKEAIYVMCETIKSEDLIVKYKLPYKLKFIPDVQINKEGEHKLALSREIKTYYCKYVNRELDNYRAAIKFAKQLSLIDKTMLSEKAERLLMLEEYEIEHNKNLKPIIRDESNGKQLKEMPNSEVDDKLFVVHLENSDYETYGQRILMDMDGNLTTYTYSLIEKSKCLCKQIITFDDFEEANDEY